MIKAEIGTVVNIKESGKEGVIVRIAGAYIHVEITNADGSKQQNIFIHEELEPVAPAPEKVDTDGQKTDLQTGGTTDNNGGVKDVSGESSTSGPAAASGAAETPAGAASTGGAGDGAGNGNAGAAGDTSLSGSASATSAGSASGTGTASDAEVAAQNKAAAEAQPGDDTMLLGSNTQPATFALEDGTVVQLGTVVASAQTDSGFTAAEWNALDDADREEMIAEAVAKLQLAKADA